MATENELRVINYQQCMMVEKVQSSFFNKPSYTADVRHICPRISKDNSIRMDMVVVHKKGARECRKRAPMGT